MNKQKQYMQGFGTIFFLILLALAALTYFYWDEITQTLQTTFTVGEERQSEVEQAIDEIE